MNQPDHGSSAGPTVHGGVGGTALPGAGGSPNSRRGRADPGGDAAQARLRRDIAVVVIIKLVAIAALWAWFVRDARVPADAGATAEHLGFAAPAVSSRQLPGARHAD